MPDDDKLMQQFIERATPKLLEAMQESVAKLVEDQLGGFKENAEKLLDEVQDAKRAQAEAAEKAKAEGDQFAALLKQNPTDPKAVTDNFGSRDNVQLTRTQARDPSLYRRAKAEAEKRGFAHPQIVNDPE